MDEAILLPIGVLFCIGMLGVGVYFFVFAPGEEGETPPIETSAASLNNNESVVFNESETTPTVSVNESVPLINSSVNSSVNLTNSSEDDENSEILPIELNFDCMKNADPKKCVSNNLSYEICLDYDQQLICIENFPVGYVENGAVKYDDYMDDVLGVVPIDLRRKGRCIDRCSFIAEKDGNFRFGYSCVHICLD